MFLYKTSYLCLYHLSWLLWVRLSFFPVMLQLHFLFGLDFQQGLQTISWLGLPGSVNQILMLVHHTPGRKWNEIFLFNDALNTFYLRLYGVRHMVKDHSASEKGNPLPPHRLLFPINSKGSFICTIPQTYHSLCYTSHGALAGTRNSSMGPPLEGSIRRCIAPWADALTMELHLAPPHTNVSFRSVALKTSDATHPEWCLL